MTASLTVGDLERYTTIGSEPRGPSPLPLPASFGLDLSRPSSTSTFSTHSLAYSHPPYHQRSASLSLHTPQRPALPGLSSLTSLAATAPQIRSYTPSHVSMNYQTHISPIPTPGIAGCIPPVCQNCQTSTTPLWRRDEAGSVLCNACGLFLKLHGRPRPISLKTDVIKSRNRVKSANQGPRKKFDTNGLPAPHPDYAASQNGATMAALNAHRRVSQMAADGTSPRSHSPISRTGTPGMHDPNIAPQHLFDGVMLTEAPFGASPSLPSLHLGRTSPPNSQTNDRNAETSLSYDQLVAVNMNLKTRVSELEVINMVYTDNETNLSSKYADVVKERDSLKRRVEELEQQLQATQQDSEQHPAKRTRLSEGSVSQGD